MVLRDAAGTLRAVAVAVVAIGLVAGPAQATNGYLIHGIGTRAKALAGAGAAFPQDALAAGTNPAGMAFIGKRYDAGVGLFSPSRQYTVSGNPSLALGTFGLVPGTVESDSELFVVPNFGAAWARGGDSTVGLSIYGQGGMNTDYPTATFFASRPVGVDLSQLLIVPSWATRFGAGGRHAFGVAPILAVQFFEVQGLQAFGGFSSNPASLTNNGHDQSTGFGARLGYLYKPPSGLSFALSWQSEIGMDELSDYAGLFAGAGDFDIPSNWVAGIAYEAANGAVFMLDYQEILYSDVAAVGNPMFPALGRAFMGDPTGLLGAESGPGFGWQDMSVFKAGFQWGGDPWTWRAGFSTGDQPVQPSEVFFNILAPGVMEEHFTVGFSRLTGGGEINLSLMYAPSVTVSGPNPLELPNAQTIALEMGQLDLEIGYSWAF